LNDTSTISGQNYKIAGLVFNYWSFNFRGAFSAIQYFMRFRFQPSINAFATESCYVDLTFLGSASTTNGNPRVFWKTCDGISGYIPLTNRFSVGTLVTAAPVSSLSTALGKLIFGVTGP
jgi:hypothetical protein